MNEFVSTGDANDVAISTGSDAFHVTAKWVERTGVVAAAGELDMLTAPTLAHAVQVAAREEPAAMVLDLTAVDFLASAGLNLLVDAHREVTRFARFAIVADGRATCRPLMLTGIDNLMTVHRTLVAALANFADS